MCTCASCNLRLLSVPSYRLSRVNGGGEVHSSPRDISTRVSPSCPLPSGPPSSFPSPSSSVPCTPGESADLFKRRSRRGAAGFVTRVARFSHPGFASIFISDSCPRRYMFSTIYFSSDSKRLKAIYLVAIFGSLISPR